MLLPFWWFCRVGFFSLFLFIFFLKIDFSSRSFLLLCFIFILASFLYFSFILFFCFMLFFLSCFISVNAFLFLFHFISISSHIFSLLLFSIYFLCLQLRLGCDGRLCAGIASDTRRLKRVFILLGVSSSARFSWEDQVCLRGRCCVQKMMRFCVQLLLKRGATEPSSVNTGQLSGGGFFEGLRCQPPQPPNSVHDFCGIWTDCHEHLLDTVGSSTPNTMFFFCSSCLASFGPQDASRQSSAVPPAPTGRTSPCPCSA